MEASHASPPSVPPTVTERNCELILGNGNPRFSGVTSTMLQNFAFQKEIMPTLIMGRAHVDDKRHQTSFLALALRCRGHVDGRWRIFHARRNNEVVLALILKYVFRVRIKVVFTSTAQRHHSCLTKWLIRKVDGLLSTCAAAAHFLDREPDQIIPHGIHAKEFTRAPQDQREKCLEQWQIKTAKVCGIFGRVREQKGVHRFVRSCIEILKDNPAWTALIVGAIKPSDKRYVAQLQRQIKEAGLEDRIRFLGEQPFSELPKLFSIMDVVCALSRTEGFGLTVLEAMSSGAAVVATKAGAWPEVVREGVDGYLVDVEDQPQITSAMEKLLDDPALAARFGENGRKRVLDNYLASIEAARLCDYFRSLQ